MDVAEDALETAAGILWELARSQRMFLRDGDVAVKVPAALMDRIDVLVGYDEMGQ